MQCRYGWLIYAWNWESCIKHCQHPQAVVFIHQFNAHHMESSLSDISSYCCSSIWGICCSFLFCRLFIFNYLNYSHFQMASILSLNGFLNFSGFVENSAFDAKALVFVVSRLSNVAFFLANKSSGVKAVFFCSVWNVRRLRFVRFCKIR